MLSNWKFQTFSLGIVCNFLFRKTSLDEQSPNPIKLLTIDNTAIYVDMYN